MTRETGSAEWHAGWDAAMKECEDCILAAERTKESALRLAAQAYLHAKTIADLLMPAHDVFMAEDAAKPQRFIVEEFDL